MSIIRRLAILLRPALIVLPLTFPLAGCETFEKLNPFAEKETPLPGERRPLFPEGVPGVEFGSPPPQPSNSNIPIMPATRGDEQSEPAQEQQSAQTARTQTPAQANPQPAQPTAQQPAAKSSKASKGNPDDAWAGAR